MQFVHDKSTPTFLSPRVFTSFISYQKSSGITCRLSHGSSFSQPNKLLETYPAHGLTLNLESLVNASISMKSAWSVVCSHPLLPNTIDIYCHIHSLGFFNVWILTKSCRVFFLPISYFLLGGNCLPDSLGHVEIWEHWVVKVDLEENEHSLARHWLQVRQSSKYPSKRTLVSRHRKASYFHRQESPRVTLGFEIVGCILNPTRCTIFQVSDPILSQSVH